MKKPKLDYATMLFRRTTEAQVFVDDDVDESKPSTYDNDNVNDLEDNLVSHRITLVMFSLLLTIFSKNKIEENTRNTSVSFE